MLIYGVQNIQFLARGKRSEVFKGNFKKGKIAIKVYKTADAKIRAKKEAKFLNILNEKKIGPKLLRHKNNYIIYKLIDGPTFVDWIKTANKNLILNAVKEILNQCFKLDSLRINKLELNKPKKHILMERNKPKFIDFERCYYTNKPKNLTQICQYLTSKSISLILKEKKIIINKTILINSLKIYKRNMNKTNFQSIINCVIN
ncbi:MAG TPA: hypothetical protein VJH20_05830 [Candidatus Nanoarchaeia archaeon]|nr:hypothetical protein [Candidatus Nanoarchaeia archaeon]